MGNSRSAPAPNNVPPSSIPAGNQYPTQGQYYHPSRSTMGDPKKNPGGVIDCNKAAELYGGYVVSEHGGYRRKPPQGLVP
ncbi:hypothetical protein PanWU01x14_141440 [Parasponia andersonii]|uniref:Uncharacterized protein n=1 Tax=Parasponia andersonii TaxID=3476 RepID=A0A2P5CLN0_PARAD|nr:hypothetical protein PanWU01x14_141440 [Parasponia andersonii]